MAYLLDTDPTRVCANGVEHQGVATGPAHKVQYKHLKSGMDLQSTKLTNFRNVRKEAS